MHCKNCKAYFVRFPCPECGQQEIEIPVKPTESELKNLNYSKRYLYNFIRMLADPYPNAFIKIGKRKIIFQSAKYNGKKLEIKGEID